MHGKDFKNEKRDALIEHHVQNFAPFIVTFLSYLLNNRFRISFIMIALFVLFEVKGQGSRQTGVDATECVTRDFMRTFL